MESIRSEEGSGVARKRRGRSEIDRLVEEYRASGQTQESFARERGLNVGTLRGWLYRRGKYESAGLREVVMRAEATKEVHAVVVRTGRGVEVELPLCAGRGWIERMVRELAGS